MKNKVICVGFALLLAALRLCGADVAVPSAMRLELAAPTEYQVIQRETRAEGRMIIAGSLERDSREAGYADTLEARLIGKSIAGALPGKWQPLPCDARVAGFRTELAVPAGGWYRLEVRALRGGQTIATAFIEHVGVGEVFVVAGQSNSANYGEEKQATETGLVAAFDGAGWRLAVDPEPGAGGKKGSFMPPFGDALVEKFNVPVGLVPMGIGATSVREWLPAGARFPRPPTLTHNVVTVGAGQWEAKGKIFSDFTARMKQLGPHGFRAVLWHQGESDAHQADAERTLPGELYREYLGRLIGESRKQIGWEAPWFVAQVSYHNPSDVASPDLRAAQQALWDCGMALEGPDTDALTGDMREQNGQGVHLSGKGLRAHGRLWTAKVGPWLERQLQEAR